MEDRHVRSLVLVLAPVFGGEVVYDIKVAERRGGLA